MSPVTWAPAAAIDLGHVYRQRGDLDAAERYYQRALASEHPTWAPAAGNN